MITAYLRGFYIGSIHHTGKQAWLAILSDTPAKSGTALAGSAKVLGTYRNKRNALAAIYRGASPALNKLQRVAVAECFKPRAVQKAENFGTRYGAGPATFGGLAVSRKTRPQGTDTRTLAERVKSLPSTFTAKPGRGGK